MAIDSTPAALSLGASVFTAPSSSGIKTLPRPSSRSGMPNRRSRATSGAGFTMKMSYCSKRCSKAISIESRKPSVTTSAVLAPLRSMMALVASVVPWMISPSSAGLMPDCFSTSSIPVSTPSSGARGVVSTFTLVSLPCQSRQRSVKVPPISTAKRPLPIFPLLPMPPSVGCCRRDRPGGCVDRCAPRLPGLP